jgi:excisionase family DNA binding protein
MDVFTDSSSLSASQAARVLGVSLGTIHCWSDLGYLESQRTQAGQLRFSREAVEAFAGTVERPQVGALGSRKAL